MMASLHPEHLEDLRKSGISDETIRGLGIYSARPDDVARLVGWDPPGIKSALVFPYPGAEGFCRLKVFPPFKDKGGKSVRYLQRPMSGVHLYIPPFAERVLRDPTVPLAWSEGEKKAAKACQEGIPCGGLGGLWNWLEERKPIARLDEIAHVERDEILYPDSDLWSRPDLQQPVYAFGKELESRGPKVRVAIIPPGLNGEKQGLDDYLIAMERQGVQASDALSRLKTITLRHSAFTKSAQWWKGWKARRGKNGGTEGARLSGPLRLTRDLILDIAFLLSQHIFFKDKRLPLLIATWVLGTYIYDIFTFYGYLWINSPVKRCGKSLLEDILSQVCFKSTPRLSNTTEAALFRLADAGHTLILDELENLRGEDREKDGAVMSLLSHGFQAGGMVPRVEKLDGQYVVKYYGAFCPKVLAGINRLVDTIEDRSFKILLVRKTKDEKTKRFNLRKQSEGLAALRSKMQTWGAARRGDIMAVYDGIEEIEQFATLDDRFKDISEPLAAIAAFADAEATGERGNILQTMISLLKDRGNERGEGEREEAIGAFVEVAKEILGSDCGVFIYSKDLLDRVRMIEGLPWVGSTKALGNFLGKFDLVPRRDPKGKRRGYLITRDWLDNIRNRYIPSIPDFKASEASEIQNRSHFEPDFESVRRPPF